MKWSLWAIVGLLVLAGVWFSWMFRYEHAGEAFFLDRWTGELVSGFDGERFVLNARHSEAPNPFADLIPAAKKRGPFRDTEVKTNDEK